MIANDLFKQSLRLARVTLRAGRIPSTDQYAEALTAANSMLGRWSADRLKAFSIVLEPFTLIAGTKSYTIGPAGTFNTSRPQRIERANLLTSSDTRQALEVVNVDDWADVVSQDTQGPPSILYNDRASPLSTLRFNYTPAQNYPIELYSWKPFDRFVDGAAVITFPPEYEEAIVYNLAMRLAALDGKLGQVDQEVREIARTSLRDIESLNAPAPVMACDEAVLSQDATSLWDTRTNQ
jgi:hypothetical protein